MTTQVEHDRARIISDLNDTLRRSFAGGRVVMTTGVADLPDHDQLEVIAKVQAFDAFSADNDPHGEHDFGSFDLAGQKFFWKIDYYAPDMQHGSEDPADPTKTIRVLTIMHSSDY
jgi:hypothetical protein